ncbi:hypothetical protein [Microbacterium album]|uniref:PBP domain-containing protein n=1 Tax=Microbacterium album TaxID=2053191 RepID=A0A917IJF2_9MICO|nr:hypothetical protein [Microbacterium album]GGH51122.1 hypothetical protein GCM10010921_30340 [Microbacterium album]
MSTPARSRLQRATAIAAAVLAVAGSGLILGAPPAEATTPAASPVTVKWAGGNDPELQRYQPDRAHMVDNADGSGHWNDFKDLEITVDQTKGLIDQAVTVRARGMKPTERQPSSTRRHFLQAMQCWGDPTDPAFYETCQWGGFNDAEQGAHGGTSVMPAGMSQVLNNAGNITSRGEGRGPVEAGEYPRFRAVTNQVNEPEPITTAGGRVQYFRGLGAFFGPSTTNEELFQPIQPDGTTEFPFRVQSAAAQPYLGCGDPRSGLGERCWLVIVPRGEHSGNRPGSDACRSNNTGLHTPFGQYQEYTGRSPIDQDCTFWDNRVVIPLDFENPYESCPPGAAERRVVGSEMLAQAMSSWQPRLCAGDAGATFNLATNSGDLVREQLVAGAVDFAGVSRPATPENLGEDGEWLLEGTDLAYAPLANSAVTIAFLAESHRDFGNMLYRDVRLTPRLVAKLLTQSYRTHTPYRFTPSATNQNDGRSSAVLRTETIVTDPEWIALGNPSAPGLRGVSARNAFMVSGPQGDDAIRLLWEYVQADADAVAFLRGEPDPWGNRINPYYLPEGHPQAPPRELDGTGGGYEVDLSRQPIDTFPVADQSKAPTAASAATLTDGRQIDALGFNPYSQSLAENALRVARVDKRTHNDYNPNLSNGPGQLTGRFYPAAPQAVPGTTNGRFVLGATLAPMAELYHLDVAQLGHPLPRKTGQDDVRWAREFVPYTPETVAAGAAAQQPADDGIAVLDMERLPPGAYPLATTVYGAVNLNSFSLDADARRDYAHLLDYVAGPGNEITGQRGGLPPGYVPLTGAQREQARELAERLRTTADELDDPAPDAPGDAPAEAGGDAGGDGAGGGAAAARGAAGAAGAADAGGLDGGPLTNPAAAPADADVTAAVGVPGQAALGGALLAGAAGLALTPFLMRRGVVDG